MADGKPLNRELVVAVFGGGTGDETRASMFTVCPLGGDSSRSTREDSLLNGVARA